MMKFVLALCLLLLAFYGATQEEIIINNGFLGEQAWGGSIHPSGKFVVKADRSVIHAYDIKTNTLFQTYESPCIANDINFSVDGKFMIVTSFGEIAEDCNRTVVYDFETGEQLFSEIGKPIINYGNSNLLYHFKDYNYIANEDESDSIKNVINIYRFDDLTRPIETIYNFGPTTIDTLTKVFFIENNEEFWFSGCLSNLEKISVEFWQERLSEEEVDNFQHLLNTQEYGLICETHRNTSDLLSQNSQMFAFDSLLFIENDFSSVEIWNLRDSSFIHVIDSARLFGLNYLKNNKSFYFQAIDKSKIIKFDLKDFIQSSVPIEIYNNDGFVAKNDSTFYTINLLNSSVIVEIYNDSGKILSNFSIPHDCKDLYPNNEYYSKVLAENGQILHNKTLLIDVLKKTTRTFLTTVDTNLMHPGYLSFQPEFPNKIQINDWDWNLNELKQFTKHNSTVFDTSFLISDSLVLIEKNVTNYKNLLLSELSMFDFEDLSYPFPKNSLWSSNSDEINRYDSLFLDWKSNVDYLSLYSDKENIFLVDEGYLNYLKMNFWNSKKIEKEEQKFKLFVEEFFEPNRIMQLNPLPEFVLFQVKQSFYQFDNELLDYEKSFVYSKKNHQSWMYDPIIIPTEYTKIKILEKAISGFTRNIFKPYLSIRTLNGKTESWYNINIVNRESLPVLDYAGIDPDNDIYYSDLTFPISNSRMISLNYAYGIFKLLDSTGKQISQSSLYRNGEFIHVMPDGYYFASKQKLNRISIRLGSQIFPIEQFDLKLNRPDIVLERLGCEDHELLNSLKAAYQKRLLKMGFTEEMLKPGFHIPEVAIFNAENIPGSTSERNLSLSMILEDSLYLLDRINVWINDVPIYGTKGIDLRSKNTKKSIEEISIDLARGENKIQISVLNQAGAESLKETIHVTCTAEGNKKPDLFLVTIGVSEYLESDYNLKYAAKDAQDIQKQFEVNSQGIYQEVHAIALLNEQVTNKSVSGLKEFLKNANRDDVVMITIAGHGVLDENYDYYLATHDINFNHPAQKGLLYDDLESLLDGILPLRKMLFIDACHSGELEKDAIIAVNTNSVTKKEVGRGAEVLGDEEKVNTSELTKELFSDLRRGTGATVISASGGMEVAFESSDWQNGLFTYCLLHGLKDFSADKNKDGQIMLSELQTYLQEEVFKLSNGAQKPTSRIENLSLDFRVW